ncbi:oligosaccharide flippase family protein [Tenacibaculum sp. 190524A02b]|uniref:oligosaccharide flippase family protein n=1 Tax=Tenacibaculum vairaonense TaxID=3137860 RepID=UPI0032B2E570
MLTNSSFNKFLNVLLRVSGMGSKFLLFTILSKYFTNLTYGNYSLITSIITIMIFVLGIDFYNYGIRDILNTRNKDEIKNKLFSSFVLYIFTYSIFLLIGFFIFNELSYTKEYVFIIIFLCIAEHFSQEVYRVLVAFNKVLFANILLFIRTTIWSTYIILLVYRNVELGISFILKLWLISDLITIVIPFFYFLKIKDILSMKFIPSWIKKGIKVSLIFFTGTVFLKLIEYANRFIVDAFLGREIVGVYTFYSSIAILITVYINTIVISFELPNILKAKKTDLERALFSKLKKSLLTQTLLISIVLLIIIHPILMWQNKHVYKEYLPILYFMIAGVGLMNYSLHYHFKLYAKHYDTELLKTIVVSGVISLTISIVLTYKFGVYGASSAFVISGGVLYINRFIAVKKLNI